jgi:hypothetical protein
MEETLRESIRLNPFTEEIPQKKALCIFDKYINRDGRVISHSASAKDFI